MPFVQIEEVLVVFATDDFELFAFPGVSFENETSVASHLKLEMLTRSVEEDQINRASALTLQ